jgi:tetratricopeptide (TPR) repeat protein
MEQNEFDDIINAGFRKLAEDPSGALRLAKTCIDPLTAQPKHDRAYELLGFAHFRWHQPEDAIEAFTVGLRHNHESPALYLGRAQAYRLSGNTKRAHGDLKHAIEFAKDNDGVIFELGCVEEELGLVRDAIARYERAIAINPEDRYKSALGIALLECAVNDWARDTDNDVLVPTTYQHIQTARAYLAKAQALLESQTTRDPKLADGAQQLGRNIDIADKRRFFGKKVPGAAALLLGLLLSSGGGGLFAYTLLVGGALYFVALRPHQYDLNRKAFDEGQLTAFDRFMWTLYYEPVRASPRDEPGHVLMKMVAKRVGGVLLVPATTAWAMFENYDVVDIVKLEANKLFGKVREVDTTKLVSDANKLVSKARKPA